MAQHLSRTTRGFVGGRSHRRRSEGQSPYEIVTTRIIKALEEGVVPWRKPWQEHSALPCNAVSHRPYHGINLFLLSLARYRDHRWLTYRQAEGLGGHVKTDEESSIAVLWKQWEPKEKEECNGQRRRESIPLLRFYHLFNVAQCEGLGLPETESSARAHHQRIEAAEELVRSMQNSPRIHAGSKVACYSPQLDLVQIPTIDAFVSPDTYYATLFHELGHATGHETRLNRPGVMGTHRFGTNDYSREELVAELTSAFCSASLGLDNSLIDNSASYIQGWITTLKADAKAIVTASAQAQRAADYLRGGREEEDRFGSGNDSPFEATA